MERDYKKSLLPLLSVSIMLALSGCGGSGSNSSSASSSSVSGTAMAGPFKSGQVCAYKLTNPDYPSLTQRENDVLQMISKGFTQSECARLLGISLNTVTGYVKEIYRKLNISSRAEAALIAKEMGLV